jgi:PDZ domain
MSKLSRLGGIAGLACLFPWVGFAQDNSFATTIQNNAMWGGNLTQQMINLGGTPTSGGARPFSPANCMPPVDLQRGADGHVPPELQGDPRYQEYLRCKQGIPPQGASTVGAPQFPVATHHLPITATDFMPARPGHPTVDEAIANMSITPEQRKQVHDGVDKTFRHIATQYRGNNLAVSLAAAYTTSMITLNNSLMTPQQIQEFIYGVNDQLAQNPQFALLSAQQKQDQSDKFIFQAAMIAALQDAGRTSPEAKQQSLDLSRVVLAQFGVGDAASMPSSDKAVLGVRYGPLSPAVAAAAGFIGSDGAFIVEVVPGSPAEKAGIKPGDILVRVGDRDIRAVVDVPSAMASVSPGSVVPVRVFRRGSESDISVVF